MRCIQNDYPGYSINIMSGNDEYDKTIDCVKEGSIFLLN